MTGTFCSAVPHPNAVLRRYRPAHNQSLRSIMALFRRTPDVLAFVLATALCSFCSVSNYYIAQASAGSANGSSCANANSVSFFNTAGNWGSGYTIGPGTTVHLCGNTTTALTFHGSG